MIQFLARSWTSSLEKHDFVDTRLIEARDT